MSIELTIFASNRKNDIKRIGLDAVAAFCRNASTAPHNRVSVFLADSGERVKTVNSGQFAVMKAFKRASKFYVPAIPQDNPDNRLFWLNRDHVKLLNRGDAGQELVFGVSGLGDMGFHLTNKEHASVLLAREITERVNRGAMKVPLYTDPELNKMILGF